MDTNKIFETKHLLQEAEQLKQLFQDLNMKDISFQFKKDKKSIKVTFFGLKFTIELWRANLLEDFSFLEANFRRYFYAELLCQMTRRNIMKKEKKNPEYQRFWQHVIMNEFQKIQFFLMVEHFDFIQIHVNDLLTSFSSETYQLYFAMKTLNELKS